MPKSKKPRHPKKRLQFKQARMRAAKFTFLVTAADNEWTPEARENATLDTLEDINAILAGDDDIRHWREVKGQFLDGLHLAMKTDQKDELLRIIVGGNKAFQFAFYYWMNKHEVLVPNLKAAQEALEEILNLRFAFTPAENFMCREQQNLDEKTSAKNEEWLDSRTGMKDREPI